MQHQAVQGGHQGTADMDITHLSQRKTLALAVTRLRIQAPAENGDVAEKPAAPGEGLIARDVYIGERDEMLEQAIALARKHDQISTSLIQRLLRVGYPRAARLMESLHEMGLVEDQKEGGKTRRSYVKDGDDPLADILGESD